MKTEVIASFIFGIAAGLYGADVVAQSYPNRPLRFVIPFPPGGGADNLARIVGQTARLTRSLARALAPELSATLGQPVIVELHPGANGATGARLVAKSNMEDGFFLRAEPDNIEPF